jgi:hypothetical protein
MSASEQFSCLSGAVTGAGSSLISRIQGAKAEAQATAQGVR